MTPSEIIEGGEGPLRVVIAGGGVAALEAMLALHELAGDRVRSELLAPGRHFVYRPLLVAEPFGLARPHRVELDTVARHCHGGHRGVTVLSVDPGAKTVRTSAGEDVAYDTLLVAVGTRARSAVDGALTFPSPEFGTLLERIDAGRVSSVAFVVPSAVGWPLPIYELALLTAERVRRAAGARPKLTVVTHEPAPLAMFGADPSRRVTELLADADVDLLPDTVARAALDGKLLMVGGREITAESVVALPRLEVPPLPGIPQSAEGFIPVGTHGEVSGLADVYAAGDATAFPIKQGGIAAQQADAAAAMIAARAGVDVDPAPFRPVLRAALLTGRAPEYIRTGKLANSPLWWPPAKIAARFLAPYIANHGERVPGSLTLADLDRYRDDAPEAADAGHREALGLALDLADAQAGWNDYDEALRWLEVAEQLNLALPPEYAERRRRWTEAARA